MNNKNILYLVIVSIILAIGFSLFLLKGEAARAQLPVLGHIKKFELTDSDGKNFSSTNLEGKTWIANFFFTTCSDICPMMNKHMASLQRSFDLVKNINLVSVTVNPENDSPEILKKYAEKYSANTKKWIFLTGPREKITEIVVGSFKLGSIEEPVFHSSYLTLVDKDGNIRGYYDSKDNQAINKLFKDAAILSQGK